MSQCESGVPESWDRTADGVPIVPVELGYEDNISIPAPVQMRGVLAGDVRWDPMLNAPTMALDDAMGGDDVPLEVLAKFRAIEITLRLDERRWGLWPMIWGSDVWVNGVPLFKVMVLVNVLGWVVFLLLR